MSSLPQTMHRVLTIPELLDTIFKSLDNNSNLTNALVCRSWSEVALDALWRHVDDLHRLFNLLAPLRVKEGDLKQVEFSRLPESSDWKRFQKYSKRVRELEYDESRHSPTLCQSVFDDIGRTRTSFAILPSVHTINWRAPLLLCVMFMYTNVKRFSIHLPDMIADVSPRPFFEDIANRMPRLTHIDIRTNIPIRKLEKDIIRLLSSLPNLQKVTTPRFYFTASVATCLSHLPKLGCIEFQYYDEQGAGDPADVTIFQPQLDEGAFPSLWDLSVTASYSDVQRFLTIPFAPTNLTMLYIESPHLESPSDIHQLLTAISENSQMLKQLVLISPRRVDGASLIPADASRTWKSSRNDGPRLKHLTSTLNPQLRLFRFDPRSPFPFAQHCPYLVYLGLFLNASVDLIPPSSASSVFPIFRRLQKLAMGLSVIDEHTPVASFLSQILPSGCQIDSGIIWDETFELGSGHTNIVGRRYETWTKVNDLLPTLIQVRAEERQRAEELRRELNEVKERVRKLTEKWDIMVGSGDNYSISL
ncbi:hypothetical protein D9756_002838 [Leucocoprinus leucothites]|uniref:F-box domain-containing protein n=1 Tax=Leucocoprinus leucothites TaxID=201217 RepID=A0A8H5LM03_9AGAR|nr:hypothetical protein D9756_002838 [Leucoagaricus leucothites]